MVNIIYIPKWVVSWINFIALLVFIVLQPLAGMLSDRIGRRSLLMSFGIFGTLLTVTLFLFMEQAKSSIVAFLLMMASLIIITGTLLSMRSGKPSFSRPQSVPSV